MSLSYRFPDRDPNKPAESQGLFAKFTIRRNDGSDLDGGRHHGCKYFVLDISHDPYAEAALLAYAQACRETHPQLAADIEAQFHGRVTAR